MITHGEFKDTCKEHYVEYLDDDKIIAWFSIHPPKDGHEKFYPLPLGVTQEKKYYHDTVALNKYLKELRENSPKTKLLYMNFDDKGNPERQRAHRLLPFQDSCSTEHAPIPFEDYLKEMAGYKFALAPRGWGPDSNRTWEALLVGTIPIVRRCQFDAFFLPSSSFAPIDKLGSEDQYSMIPSYSRSQLDTLYEELPIVVVDDWSEITEDFLHKKYEEITSREYDLRRLYMEYWKNKVFQVRDAYFAQRGLPRVDTLRKKEKNPISHVDSDDAEAREVLANLTLDFLGKSLREKLALQSNPIQKIVSKEDCNYYLLRCAFDPEEFYILRYDRYFGGEFLLIIQTDLLGNPLGKAKLFLPEKMEKVGEVRALAYLGKIIIINPEFRGLGYGSKLFDVTMDILRNRNISKIILNVLNGTDNTPALKLYERNGFQRDLEAPEDTYHMYKIFESPDQTKPARGNS